MELLAFGFCNENYQNTIPDAIGRVIRLFYDEYFYWRIEKAAMTQFLNAKNGDVMHSPSTFTIKGIEFECTMSKCMERRRYRIC